MITCFTFLKNVSLTFTLILSVAFHSSGQGRLERHNVSSGYNYIAYLPNEYNPELMDDWPVLFYLHGGQGIKDGMEGFDNFAFFKFGPPALIDNLINPSPDSRFRYSSKKWSSDKFIVIVPHLPRDEVTYPQINNQLWDVNRIYEVVQHVFSEYHERSNNIYFTGVSLGAKGVWDFSMTYPEIAAAIIPISGTGLLADACDIKHVPVWAFHGEKDQLAYNEKSETQLGRWGSKSIVDKINTCPGRTINAKFTLFPYKIHEPAVWDNVYNLSSGYDIYNWLLKHEKGSTTNIPPYGRITQSDQKRLIDPEGQITIKLESDVFDTNWGDDVNYTWTLKSGDKNNFSFRTASNQEILTPTEPSVFATFTAAGSYTISLEVDDGVVEARTSTSEKQASTSVYDEVEITITSSINDIYVAKLQLYNAGDGAFLKDLKNGEKIDTEALGTNNFNIRAVLNAPSYNKRNVQSVKFSLDEDENFSMVTDFGSNGGTSYYMFTKRQGIAWNPADGEYIIAATPFYDKTNPPTDPGITNQIVVYVNEEPPVILPVEFLDISAKRVGGKVAINWSTASESGNDFFTVERSPVASDRFEAIGMQNGAGDSKEIKKYGFTDYAPLAGDAYYRIKQTDVDGQSSYSKIVQVKGAAAFAAALFPNPTEKGNLHIRLSTADSYSEVNLHIIDAIGNVVYVGNLAPEELREDNGYKLQLGSNINPGLYFVIVKQGTNSIQHKLVVK